MSSIDTVLLPSQHTNEILSASCYIYLFDKIEENKFTALLGYLAKNLTGL